MKRRQAAAVTFESYQSATWHACKAALDALKMSTTQAQYGHLAYDEEMPEHLRVEVQDLIWHADSVESELESEREDLAARDQELKEAEASWESEKEELCAALEQAEAQRDALAERLEKADPDRSEPARATQPCKAEPNLPAVNRHGEPNGGLYGMAKEAKKRGPGRPATLQGARRVCVVLDQATIDRAQAIGESLSAGLRAAVAAYPAGQAARPRPMRKVA